MLLDIDRANKTLYIDCRESKIVAKLKTPLLSFEAHKSIGNAVTFQSGGGRKFAREKPIPTYRRTLAQLYQRWLYQDYAHQWTELSAATRAAYRASGVRFHLTGFQYWMKTQLGTLPDINVWYRMDDNLGATTIDSSKNGYTAVILGPSPSDGLIGPAFYFDGINDYLSTPITPALIVGTTDFSLTIALRIELMMGDFRMIIADRLANNLGVYLNNPATPTTTRLVLVKGGVFSFTAVIAWELARWYTIHVIQVGGLTFFFRDCCLISFMANAGNVLPITHLDTGYRKLGNEYPFQGNLDNLIFYNRALTLTEIEKQAERRYPP